MNIFVENPNLPKAAKNIYIGKKYKELLNVSLIKLGFEPVYVPDNPLVDPRLSGHCDLSMLHGGGERVFLAPYLKGSCFAGELSRLGVKPFFPDIFQSANYPHDAQMNVAVVGKSFICNKDVNSLEIINYLTIKGFMPITSKQGYSRCSTCIVDENSLITSDRGIAAAAELGGLSVLRIASGYVELPGYACGFFGGAAFRLREDLMAFTGSIDSHPDKDNILKFLDDRGISAVFLTALPIFDIGGAVALTEKMPS